LAKKLVEMEKNTGIVLKNYYPSKCKLALLDRDLGKIMAVPHRVDISHGTLISYFSRTQESMHFIYNIDIMDMPLALAQHDIFFVHHVLELCYYFIPQGSQALHVFRTLLHFYEFPVILDTPVMKKIFIMKIFFMLGVHPEGNYLRNAQCIELLSTSIDILASRSIDLSIEQELDVWLEYCIKNHPRSEYFKTMNFLFKTKAL
jgi:hypothetical protein